MQTARKWMMKREGSTQDGCDWTLIGTVSKSAKYLAANARTGDAPRESEIFSELERGKL